MKPGTDGKGTTTQCPVCGKNFNRKYKGQIFCDRACSARGRRTWNDAKDYAAKKEKPKRFCKCCGKEFTPLYSQSKHCSIYCKNKYASDRAKERMAETLKEAEVCIICGRHFIRKHPGQKICSEKCRQEANAEVTIRITKPGNGLLPEMQPQVGKTYRARRIPRIGDGGVMYIVPGFGKYGVILKEEEAETITV